MTLPGFLLRALRRHAFRVMLTADEDFVIGAQPDPYLLRWYLIPHNRVLNVFLHFILRDDDDRACHDHPWPSVSVLLEGELGEWRLADPRRFPGGDRLYQRRQFRRGEMVFRGARYAHRLVVPAGAPAVTLFITGPRIREWGFWCRSGWRHWRVFTNPDDGGSTIGRGCE